LTPLAPPLYGVGMQQLRGRNAIVTGASRGLGVYIARALAAEGMNLALCARSLEPIAALASELSQTGVRAIAIRADVALAADRGELLRRAPAELGAIDVLVNNAGLEKNAAFSDFSPEAIEQMIQVDLIAPMLLTRALLPGLLERKTGHVINIASLAGKSATPYNVPYSAAKGGLVLFTQSLRAELRGSGVSASVICPGFISETGMFADKERSHAVQASPLAGTISPQAVARLVVRALRNDAVEILAAPGPMRLSQAFNQLFPAAFAWFVMRTGIMDPFKITATSKRDS
jgi:short-subunit dehydrogenase